MNLEPTCIEGLLVIRLRPCRDLRGHFLKPFNASQFRDHGLETDFKECYFSTSHKNVLRGMHYQQPPFECTKVVFVNNGAALDVVLDIRHHSKTYGNYFSVTLSQEDPLALYIPPGLAHGFLSLSNHTVISYLQTKEYNRHADAGVHYASFGFGWPNKNPIISERDMALDLFDNEILI